MTAHRTAKRKVWTGLVLLLLGAGLVVVAPAGAGDESSGNLTCEAVVGELGLTDPVLAKDDVQRAAPHEGTAVNGDFVVDYTFLAAPAGSPEAYVVAFSSEDLVFGVFVKQAADKQALSRSAVFPAGTLAGSVYVPAGEFSHVSFCTGTLPTTEAPTTEAPTTAPPETVPPVTVTVAPTTTEVEETTTTVAPTTTTEVEGDEVTPSTDAVPTTAAPTTAAPATTDAEVMGDVVVRELPHTGAGTVVLSVAGVLMVLLGSYLVAQSDRELRRQTRS